MTSRSLSFIATLAFAFSCGGGNHVTVTQSDEICANGLDDNEDGKVDCADPTCFSDPSCAVRLERCDNEMDDNGDGQIDCADHQCEGQSCGYECVCHNGVATDAPGGDAGSTGGGTGTDAGQTGGGTGTDAGHTGGGTATTGGGSATGGGTGTTGGGTNSLIENCSNGVDDNANGLTDCEESSCNGQVCGANSYCIGTECWVDQSTIDAGAGGGTGTTGGGVGTTGGGVGTTGGGVGTTGGGVGTTGGGVGTLGGGVGTTGGGVGTLGGGTGTSGGGTGTTGGGTGTSDGGCTTTDIILNGGFEDRTTTVWTEASDNYGSPVCSVADCGMGATGPYAGTYWAWFGGFQADADYCFWLGTDCDELASVTQTVVIPTGSSATLSFQFSIPNCGDGDNSVYTDSSGNPVDLFNVKVDSTVLYVANNYDARCGTASYQPVSIDVSSSANGASHVVKFLGYTADLTTLTNFMVDDVKLTVCQ